MMPQINLPEWVEALEKANLLKRIKEEKRVDELPMLMEQNPDNAILVENVKDAKFPFLSGAYGTRSMFAMQLGCKEGKISEVVSKRLESLKKPTIVSGAAFQEVVIRGNDVDLTVFPLFCHHPRDGQAFLNDTNIVTCDPDTGIHDIGIYRLMYREKNVTSINMQNVTRTTRVNAEKFREQGKELPVACILGGAAAEQARPVRDDTGCR